MTHNVDRWLSELPQADDIYVLSKDRCFGHPEQEHDKYVVEPIVPAIGQLILNHARKAPRNILEIGCGSGLLTASLIHAGGMQTIVASDPSTEFLKLTRQKVAPLSQSERLRA